MATALTTDNLHTAKKLPPRPAGRPKSSQVAALNNHVLTVAREVFCDQGFGGATFDEIALRAQVSKPTLYKRFPTKEKLFHAVVTTLVDSWKEGVMDKNPIIVTNTIEEALRHHVTVQVRASLSGEFSDLVRLILAEQHKFPELAKAMSDASYQGRIVAVTDDIYRFAEIDKVPVRNAESAANLLRSMVGGALIQIKNEGSSFGPAEQDAFIDRVTEMFLASRPAW